MRQPFHLIDIHIDCRNLLASWVGVGLVSMWPIEDVGGWSLLALLRPFIIWLSSEVFTLLQSMQNCFYFETLWHWSLYRIVTTQPQARARVTVDSNISILCPIPTRLKILTGDSAPAPAPTCYIFGSNKLHLSSQQLTTTLYPYDGWTVIWTQIKHKSVYLI